MFSYVTFVISIMLKDSMLVFDLLLQLVFVKFIHEVSAWSIKSVVQYLKNAEVYVNI